MLLKIPEVLTRDQVRACREMMESAEWVDGRVTAGYQSARAKNNLQLPENADVTKRLQGIVLAALGENLAFVSAALPLKIFPPLFNCYRGGQAFGTHVDNAIRPVRGTPHKIRTDVSCTLFLSDPEEYDGGELVIEDTYGTHAVKLPAGHMVLYPSTSLHRVTPVTRGARFASFFWTQSMVRDDGQRTLLYDLDMAIQRVRQNGDEQTEVQLTGIYHNLLRRWADT